ncbi:MAG: hypothetical protein ACI35P_03480 [Bacillus sp. (in: firmicutes)]
MLTVRLGEKKDQSKIRKFIIQSDATYVEDSLFITVENEQRELMAVLGIQVFENVGLLRSFVFVLSFPTEKLPIFLERALVVAKENGCEKLYMATNKQDSIPFFEAFGFDQISFADIVDKELSTAIQPFSEKKQVVFMWKTL